MDRHLGAVPPPRGRVVPLAPVPATYAVAVDRYLTSAGIAASSARVYRVSLTTWCWPLAGQHPPPGRARRGARPPALDLADLDDPALPERLAAAYAARVSEVDADTVNRELAVVRAAVAWWRGQGWIDSDPTLGLERRPAPYDRTRALPREQVERLFRLEAPLREKTLWRLLYESAARAEEVLCLNIEDLDLPNKRARTIAKGGAIEWIHWQSGTAQLLPRLIAGRTRGPLFLTDRKAPSRTPMLDTCPTTGRARLSYRRAAELFEYQTRAITSPNGQARGFTLHQLRHAALTHDAESGTSTPMLLARSRHATARSLERYARPGVDAVASHVAHLDPATRRRAPGPS
ncbi:Tyr recombinase domain-containing protein [Frankia sp. Hr75.2]|nr:Tyr recombinase domain-containing protein [Frankia sp. Hr75.2]